MADRRNDRVVFFVLGRFRRDGQRWAAVFSASRRRIRAVASLLNFQPTCANPRPGPMSAESGLFGARAGGFNLKRGAGQYGVDVGPLSLNWLLAWPFTALAINAPVKRPKKAAGPLRPYLLGLRCIYIVDVPSRVKVSQKGEMKHVLSAFGASMCPKLVREVMSHNRPVRVNALLALCEELQIRRVWLVV